VPTEDPYAEAWQAVTEAVLESQGALQTYVRRAIARGEDPLELAALLDKTRGQAYKIVDADVEGVNLDIVFEAVLAAALGEGDRRRRAALKAIG
jgi:ABC-type transporter MlaC component